MAFTDDEIRYLRSQPLARIATVDADGQPDAVPVVFEFDGIERKAFESVAPLFQSVGSRSWQAQQQVSLGIRKRFRRMTRFGRF